MECVMATGARQIKFAHGCRGVHRGTFRARQLARQTQTAPSRCLSGARALTEIDTNAQKSLNSMRVDESVSELPREVEIITSRKP